MNQSTAPVNGEVGQALKFNGTNSYIIIPSAPFGNYPTSGNTSNYNLSFSTWFKTTSGGVIFGQDDGVLPGGIPSGYVPSIYIDTNGKIRASLIWHDLVGNQIISTNSYNDGNWHLLSDAYNSGTETLYIDRNFVGTQTYNEYSYNSTYAYFLGTGYTSGAWANGNSSWYYFNGNLDDVRVYNRALSASEITQLYNLGSANHISSSQIVTATSSCAAGVSCGLVGYWTFDGKNTHWTSSSTATTDDVSGNGNTATLNNMNQATAPVLGKVGQALGFLGTNQYVDTGNTSSLNLPNNGSVTMCAWIKPYRAPVNSGIDFMGIMAKRDDRLGIPYAYGINYGWNWGAYYFQVYSSNSGAVSFSTFVPKLNAWTHVCGVISSGPTALYVNGLLFGSNGSGGGVSSNTADFCIGSSCISSVGTPNEPFDGAIDDARIYNRALSANEIKQLYDLGR